MVQFTPERLEDLAIAFLDDESHWGKEVKFLIGDYLALIKQSEMLKSQNKTLASQIAKMNQLVALIGDHIDYIKEKTWPYQQDNYIAELNSIDSAYTDRGVYDQDDIR